MAETKNIPDWVLERHRLKELDADTARGLGLEQLDVSESTRKLDLHDREFLARYPARGMAAAILERKMRRRSDRRQSVRTLVPAFAAVAAGLALVMPPAIRSIHHGSQVTELPWQGNSDFRHKGLKPGLVIHRKLGEVVEKLANHEQVRAGDLVQLSYVSGGSRYGVILSLDGQGKITWHLPKEGGKGPLRAVELRVDGEALLPEAFELDNSPGFEKFFLLTSDRAFSREEALRVVGQGAVAGIAVFTMELKK